MKPKPEAPLVHERFAEHAAQRPDAIALRFEGRAMSYGELERRANQLARHLREEGVRAGALVGLRVERSFETIVGMLGILKAGGAYVPLDPSYPAERLAFIEADAQPTVVVNAESFRGLASLDDGPLDAGSSRGDVAYVIYTSGSTGKPKGVQVEHRQVARLFTQTDAWYRFGPRDVWTLFHSFAFDFSVWEIWGALAYGGTLVIVPSAVTRDLAAFRELLAEERVTILNQTPSAFYQLMRADEASTTKLALREVIFGGEALDLAALRPWYARHADDAPRLVNMYGITETTVHVTYRPLTKQDAAEARGSLIGTAIPDLTLYVLDEHSHPATTGELYVGGAGLARGYLHRDELTAARFVTSPSGERLYRTGDQVRWLDDGTLEFLGRVDRQVKLRGFRIELGEIESTLGEVPGVRECAVLAREDVAGNKQLVAYWVGDAEPSGLRAHLETKLPAHMVPSAFVRLDAMPLSHNGKLDRAALPQSEALFVAPRTPLETTIAEAYAHVLGRGAIGVDADFFEMGGHSLLAMQLLARLKAVLRVSIAVRTLREAPTVAGLAARLETSRLVEHPQLTAAEHRGAAPLAFGQRVFFTPPGARETRWPVHLALRLDGPLRVDILERSLSEIVARHESLRMVFSVDDGAPMQDVADACAVKLVCEASSGHDAIGARVVRELESAFDQQHGPLFRFLLFREDHDEHVLVWLVDHIACDAWSLDIFTRELRALYAAFARGAASPLLPLPIQIADFAIWQRAIYTEEKLGDERAYWREQLRGAPTEIALPRDRPRTGENTFAKLELVLDASRSARVRDASHGQSGYFVTTWTAFLATLYAVSGQRDLVVGTFYADRAHSEVLEMIGPFTNLVAVRTRLSETESLASLQARLARELLDVFEHVEVPFPWVVEAVQPAPRPLRNPLLDVGFHLHHALGEGPDNADLRIAPVTLPLAFREGNRVDVFMNVFIEESFRFVVDYNPYLFEASSVAAIVERYADVLDRLVSAPSHTVGSLRAAR